ncbi:1184_t:CDS:2 [Racocetra fulgida]|uniref:tRNA (adenine(58)-N(1))-methyltransferase catalytic subunit TRM61 n=1 Tax=Racocetra fulgida TaxID=60492 RepID=A0A9N9GVL1_9GLOM|nr:1184_t:CDS:2 [Racocetra fulgida]
MTPLVMDPKLTYNNKFGTFRHSDMIGKKYGTKMPSHNGRGFMYLLHPTPELWTLVVPHRTQILYMADISFITTYLDLKPGSIILESGTGSGSFSHSLARTIAPNGHLYTFEYHEERAKAAKQDFERHGLSDITTIECRDVYKDGFGITDLVHAEVHTIPIYTVKDAVSKIKVQQDKKRKRSEEESSNSKAAKSPKIKQDPPNLYVSKTPTEAKGHTSYLTFATFLPVLDDEVEIIDKVNELD